MATNLPRKASLVEYADYNMAMNKPPGFPNNPDASNMNNPYQPNHFTNQAMNNFGLQSRQFEDSMDPRQKFTPSSGHYGGGYEPRDVQIARMQGKFRPEMFKNMDSGFNQQRNTNPWAPEFENRNSRPIKTPQARIEPTLGQNMPSDPGFPSEAAASPQQQPYQMPSPYIASDMFKQSQQFPPRGMTNNFHPQDFYQQDHMRQMTNQYHQQPQLPRSSSNFFAANQRSSSSPFGQPVLPKPAQDALYSQQFSGSPKSNGPHPGMMNIGDDRQVSFPNTNYPVSPVGSQLQSKPSFAPAMNMRATVSPNVTIGLPKKPLYRPQEEAVTSPTTNQNAAAAAAAAAVLAAVNTANPLASPQSDINNMSSRPPSVPTTRPPSIRSPATSIVSDHKSESGGSGVNEFRTTPSPAASISRNTPQLTESSSINFSSDVETGRVPSPSVNQLPNSDIEAMIHSVSNIPAPSNDLAQRSKVEIKSEVKNSQRSVLSPVTPPSPFSLSPSINVDFDIDMLSPSWEDPSSRNATPFQKLYKLSEEPHRKDFLNKLVSCMEQQGKVLHDVPNFNGVVLDLFKLYQLVSKRGGMQEVTRLRLWKEVIQSFGISSCTENDEQILREHYIRFLLPYEDKLGGGNLPRSVPLNPAAPQIADAGSIDLSAMTYKTMFQGNPPPPSSFSQGATPQPLQPPSYPNTPPTTQGFPSTPPMQHPGHRNMPQPQISGYQGYPQRSPRVPTYPSNHPNFNAQYPGFPSSQMPGYHNGMVPSRFPNYSHNSTPPEAMYAQFPRVPGVKKLQQMDPQHPEMFPNFQQQGAHPSSFMYQQQASQVAAYQMERQRQRSGVGSPRPRMQSPWPQRYPDPGSTSGSPSPFHNSQSPKLPNARPPPPYPHPKTEKPSPTPQSASAALQYQAMKAASSTKLTQVKKEDELFPAGCVEATHAHHTKKRRLTAKDIGPVEAWRIMMSLKSGLLTETAWALDTLTILLSDDATVYFFRLGHLPGFLDTVVEHFRRCLINVFDVLAESEIDTGVSERYQYNSKEATSTSYASVLPNLVAAENFSSIIVSDCLHDDSDPGFTSGIKNWKEGGGDTTIHIQTHFETDSKFYYENKENSEIEKEDFQVSEMGSDQISESKESSDHENIVKETEVRSLVNGLSSPDANTLVLPGSEIIENSAVKAKTEGLVCGVQDNCCDSEKNSEENLPENGECLPTKSESSTKETPSELLIKRLKTELDLDVESVAKDSEQISSSSSCDINTGVNVAESVCVLKQEFPLSSVTLSQESAINTCNCVSNIVRNLSYVPGNDVQMARHPSLLRILAKLLLLHHMRRKKGAENQYNDNKCWWQACLDILRENTLVTVANIAGYLDLSLLSNNVSRELLDGLLHWLVCQASVADEPLRSTSISVSLTPKQLVLETLAKMSVLETNVDHILNTPDKMRLTKAYEYLVKLFSDKTNEVTREFALVLLSSFSQAKLEICSVSSERNLVTVLVGFLEDARDKVEAMAVRGLHPGMFRDNDLRVSMGMLRRAGGLLACIAKRRQSTHLIPFQERILALSMSRALDNEVQSHLSDVLYNLPR